MLTTHNFQSFFVNFLVLLRVDEERIGSLDLILFFCFKSNRSYPNSGVSFRFVSYFLGFFLVVQSFIFRFALLFLLTCDFLDTTGSISDSCDFLDNCQTPRDLPLDIFGFLYLVLGPWIWTTLDLDTNQFQFNTIFQVWIWSIPVYYIDNSIFHYFSTRVNCDTFHFLEVQLDRSNLHSIQFISRQTTGPIDIQRSLSLVKHNAMYLPRS